MSLKSRLRDIFTGTFTPAESVGLLWLWSAIGCLGFTRTFMQVYLPAQHGYDIHDYLIGRDFVNVWTGAKLALQEKTSKLYALAEYQKEMSGLLGHPYWQHNFAYPPHILLFIPVFGLLSYLPSLAVWSVAGTACFLLALRMQEFFRPRWHVLALAALSPAGIINLVSGQNGHFIGALFLGGLYVCETSPLLGGVLFGLLTVKPHLGLLVLPVLLLRRNWKCIGSAAATALVLFALSAAIWGVAPWHEYLTQALPHQMELLKLDRGYYTLMMPGIYADVVTTLHQAILTGAIVAALAALLALGLTLRAVWKEGLTPRSILLASLGTMVILPYGFSYDMLPVAGAMVVYLGAQQGIAMWRHLSLIHI